MMVSHDLADCTATELLALFKSGAASPVEAHSAVMWRIELHNPVLKAFCHVSGIESAQNAIKSEALWIEHRKSGAAVRALEGVPASIKDLILTQGMPTLRGSHTVDETQAWEVDAPVTARLKEAGAVILGKTTTPEFGCKGETNSPRTGITRSPWNTAKTPGVVAAARRLLWPPAWGRSAWARMVRAVCAYRRRFVATLGSSPALAACRLIRSRPLAVWRIRGRTP